MYQMSGMKWRVKVAPENADLPMLFFWKKELNLQDKILEIKQIKETLHERELEATLQHEIQITCL